VSFSRDRRLAITVAQDSKSARLWDTASGQPISQPLPLHEPAKDLAFSFDGKRVLTQGDSHARLWDTATAQEVGQSLAFPGTISRAAFSLDGKTVALEGDGYFQLWDAATGIPQGGLTPMNSGQDSRVFVGSHLFTLGRRWAGPHLPFGRLANPHRTSPRFQEVRAQTRGLALTSGGPLELVTLEDGPAQIWNTYGGEAVGAPLPRPHADLSPAFSSDLRTYVIPGSDDERPQVRWDGIPRLWKVGEGKPHGQPLPLPGLALGKRVVFSPDARFLLVASSGGRPPAIGPDAWLALCDATGRRLGRVTGWDNDIIASLAAAFSPDGGLVLAAVQGNEWPGVGSPLEGTQLWAAEGGKLSSRWKGVGLALAFSPDGKRFAEGGAPANAKRYTADRKTVRLWDAVTRERVAPPLEHSAAVHAVAFSPDGTTLLTGCGNNPASPVPQGGEARLWDAATGQPARSASDGSVLRLPHQGAVVAVAFSPDGKTVLTGSTDRAARLWEADTGKMLPLPPLSHKDTVTSVAFSHDGRTVLTASRDGTSRLWDAATGKPLGPPLLHWEWDTNRVFVAFSPDDQAVLTAGRDGELTRWQVETGPVAGDVERIRLWVQVLTGMELDQEDVVGGLSHESWGKYRRQLEELGGPPLP
jgi:WD40 repeat protein